MKLLKRIVSAVVIGVIAAGVFVWSGIYDVAADKPHWELTALLLTATRNRSISEHASDIKVPDLDDPKLISMGAGHYAEMCTGCHLAPGIKSSELHQGLYPKPPLLYEAGIKDPARAFWVIKHGIKMTAMPAWGASHNDHAIWAIVAFLKQLPRLSSTQYKAMTTNTHDDD